LALLKSVLKEEVLGKESKRIENIHKVHRGIAGEEAVRGKVDKEWYSWERATSRV
jgi:hypothetical protein